MNRNLARLDRALPEELELLRGVLHLLAALLHVALHLVAAALLLQRAVARGAADALLDLAANPVALVAHGDPSSSVVMRAETPTGQSLPGPASPEAGLARRCGPTRRPRARGRPVHDASLHGDVPLRRPGAR